MVHPAAGHKEKKVECTTRIKELKVQRKGREPLGDEKKPGGEGRAAEPFPNELSKTVKEGDKRRKSVGKLPKGRAWTASKSHLKDLGGNWEVQCDFLVLKEGRRVRSIIGGRGGATLMELKTASNCCIT